MHSRTQFLMTMAIPAMAAFLPSLSSAAVLSTIATSGYNQDIFFEAGLAPTDSFATNGKGVSRAFGSRAFFESNTYGDAAKGQLQSNPGIFNSTTGNTTNFDFQSFGASNAMFVTSPTVKSTLTMTVPTVGYSTLGFVASAANLGNVDLTQFTYTINYTGGGTQVGTFLVDDWGSSSIDGSGIGILGSTRAQITAGGTPGSSTTFGETSDAGGGPFRFYLTEITTTSTANIESIDFTAAKVTGGVGGTIGGGVNDAVIMGVVGEAVPEPSTSLLAAGALGLFLIRRRR